MAGEIDFAAEGLLDGVDGDARAARAQLLRELVDDGVRLDELRAAVRQDRLALLPVDRLLSHEERHVERYTLEQLADAAGADREDLGRAMRSLGLPPAEPGVPCYSDADLEMARRHQFGVENGVPSEAIAN